jgi:hypothetical protein
MGVTQVTIGGLDIHDGTSYATSADTLTMLEAASPSDPIMVEMARRPPVYIRSQPLARSISLGVFLIDPSALTRKADFDVLKAACSNAAGLIPLTWTDDAGTYQYYVHCSNVVPSRWFSRADCDLVAPDPDPVTI